LAVKENLEEMANTVK